MHANTVNAPKNGMQNLSKFQKSTSIAHFFWHILRRRHSDNKSVRRVVQRPSFHPKNLAPTIAMKQPTETTELVKFWLARYGLKEKKSPNV